MPAASPPTQSREIALAKLLPRNALLAALPAKVQARLLPHLGLVDLRPGHTLLEQGGLSVRAFFPVAGLVALTQDAAAGTHGLVALVGSDGMLGQPLKIGDGVMRSRAVVQCPGYGLALGREPLMQEWSRGGSFRRVLSSYARVLQAQVAQLAICRRDHSIEQQLCRLLLVGLDQVHGPELGLTLGAVARLLGGEQERLTQAVRQLHEAGLIRLNRDGVFAVADAAGLQARACGCCRGDESRRLQPGPAAREVLDVTGLSDGQTAPWAGGARRAFSTVPLEGTGPR